MKGFVDVGERQAYLGLILYLGLRRSDRSGTSRSRDITKQTIIEQSR